MLKLKGVPFETTPHREALHAIGFKLLRLFWKTA